MLKNQIFIPEKNIEKILKKIMKSIDNLFNDEKEEIITIEMVNKEIEHIY